MALEDWPVTTARSTNARCIQQSFRTLEKGIANNGKADAPTQVENCYRIVIASSIGLFGPVAECERGAG